MVPYPLESTCLERVVDIRGILKEGFLIPTLFYLRLNFLVFGVELKQVFFLKGMGLFLF